MNAPNPKSDRLGWAKWVARDALSRRAAGCNANLNPDALAALLDALTTTAPAMDRPTTDTELRAINAWHRFFYPAADRNFYFGDWPDDEMGDCIRLLLAERGIDVKALPASQQLSEEGK